MASRPTSPPALLLTLSLPSSSPSQAPKEEKKDESALEIVNSPHLET